MKKIGRISGEFDLGIGFSDEDIKCVIKSRLTELLGALVCDVVEQGLELPIMINLEYERENLNQRFKAIAESLSEV